jgi:outer membrane protein TolC
MNRKRLGCILLTLILLVPFTFGQKEREEALSLEDAIFKALKNNLNVAVEIIGPELASSAVARAKEIYMPTLQLDASDQRYEQPATWSLVTTGTNISKTLDTGFSVAQQIPFGGNLSASLTYYRNETNQLFQNYNPYYQSTLRFSFTQPILKNFGWQVSRRSIIVAQNDLEASRGQFESVLIDTVFQVEQAYWNLVYAIENLEVSRQSLELGQDLLAKTKKEVEVGQTAPIEVLNAEAEVASREAAILQAEAQVKRNRDQLRALITAETASAAGDEILVPSEAPQFKPFEISFEDALRQAMSNRPDLESTRANIESKQVNFTFAKNQLLPQLDLQISKTSPGISGDRLLYENDDPFSGVVIGTIPGSFGDSFRDALKFLYNNWTIGVTLSIPLGDLVSRGQYAQAKLDLEQTQARLKRQEQQIALEVSDAILSLETDAKSVEAYRIARELAEKRLEAEMKKLSVGMTANYFVLQYQERLASARSLELKALVDYNISVARISKVTGTTLDKRGISVSDYGR